MSFYLRKAYRLLCSELIFSSDKFGAIRANELVACYTNGDCMKQLLDVVIKIMRAEMDSKLIFSLDEVDTLMEGGEMHLQSALVTSKLGITEISKLTTCDMVDTSYISFSYISF